MTRILYVALMLAGGALNFARLTYLGRSLPREAFGLYSWLAALGTYGVPLLTVGLIDALARRLPLMLGAGDDEGARSLRNETLTLLLGAQAALAVALVVVCSVPPLRRVLVPGLSIATFIAGTSVFSIAVRDVRSRLRTGLFGALMFVQAAAAALLAYSLAHRVRPEALLLGDAAVLSVVGIGTLVFGLAGVRPRRPRVDRMRDLLGDGVQLLGAAVVYNTGLLLDRIWLGAMLPRDLYGTYSVHLLAVSVGLVVANVVNQYAMPRLLYEYGASRDPAALLAAVERLALRLFVLGSGGALLGLWLAGRIWDRIFPRHHLDQTALALILAGVVVEISNQYVIALTATNQLRVQIALHAVAAVVVVVGLAIASFTSRDLRIFAAVFLCGRLASMVAFRAAATRLVRPTVALA